MDSSKVTGQGFYPTVDGDIMPNYPTELFHSGRFTHIPHLYGTNSDESTDNAPDDDVINTDFDLYAFLLNSTGFDFPPSTVREIMRLYPDDLTLSIPLNTGTERFAAQGYQFKRIAATLGDVFCHSPTYIYRFNTRPFVNNANATYTDLTGSLTRTRASSISARWRLCLGIRCLWGPGRSIGT